MSTTFPTLPIRLAIDGRQCPYCASECTGLVTLDMYEEFTQITSQCLRCLREFQIHAEPSSTHHCPLCCGLLVIAGYGFLSRSTSLVGLKCLQCLIICRRHRANASSRAEEPAPKHKIDLRAKTHSAHIRRSGLRAQSAATSARLPLQRDGTKVFSQ